MLDNLFDPNTKVLYDLKVDDRDFAEFPNFYSFCTSDKGLNTPLWPIQFWLTSTLLNEICPKCSRYKSVDDVKKDVPLDEFEANVQFMHYGVCPKCKTTRLDYFRSGGLNPYSELAGLAGQRIGKSLMVAALATYGTHKFLKLQNPAQIYGVLPTTFVGTFVGLTFDRAIQQLWLPYKNFIENSPWFVEYMKMLKDRENVLGEQLVKFNQTSLHFSHRGLLVAPSGPNRKTLRGNTRIFAACDEMDFFLTEEDGEDNVKMNGVEVYKSLSNSLFTVRIGWRDAIKRGLYGVMPGYQFNISSPQSINSPLTSIVLNNKDTKRIFTFHLATWEVHPKVSESDIRREFSDDPAKADRDFGAIPPRSSNPFLDEQEVINITSGRRNLVSLRYIHGKTPGGELRRAAVIENTIKPAVLPASLLSLDAGFSNNSFSLVVGNRTQKVEFSIVQEIVPEIGKYALDYFKIYENVIKPIIRDYNVQFVVADRWNSLKILHDIENEFHIPTLVYSLKYADFQLIKSYIQGRGISVPKRETEKSVFDYQKYPSDFIARPIDHLYLQASTVIDNGKTITKGEKLTDDTWRALSLGSKFLLDPEWCEKFLKDSKKGVFRGAIAANAHSTFSVGAPMSGTARFVGVGAHNLRNRV